jgi:DNA-binding response OmpR family regulator
VIAHVLVVDDDEQLCRALAVTLTRAGFEVTTAGGVTPAIELAETSTFDIVIVDFLLSSERTGADVVHHYKQQLGERVYCVVLSGQDDDDMRAACLAAGADRLLLKPCPPSELRRELTEATRRLRAAA